VADAVLPLNINAFEDCGCMVMQRDVHLDGFGYGWSNRICTGLIAVQTSQETAMQQLQSCCVTYLSNLASINTCSRQWIDVSAFLTYRVTLSAAHTPTLHMRCLQQARGGASSIALKLIDATCTKADGLSNDEDGFLER
jgi:hypothetical protein